MFTYQENRVLFLEKGQIVLPNHVRAVLELDRNPAFGDAVPGRSVALGSHARIMWNANTGRSAAESLPPFPPPVIDTAVAQIQFRLNGRVVEAEWDCETREELLGTLGALHFVLPLSIGLELGDAVYPVTTSGQVGEAAFVWQVESTTARGETVDPAERDSRCVRGIERLPMLCDTRSARLLAALAYFQRAVRLFLAGHGPSEFAGEIVVNLAKVLEVLFPSEPPKTRDAVRFALQELGYTSEAIERTFIPALVLRSQLDAAHVRMATLAADERRTLQQYMERVEPEFRNLLLEISNRVAAGTLVPPTYENEREPGDQLAKTLGHLD